MSLKYLVVPEGIGVERRECVCIQWLVDSRNREVNLKESLPVAKHGTAVDAQKKMYLLSLH